MHNWLVFLHILGAFGFLLAHGVSAVVSFKLRRERNLERVQALLDLSMSSVRLMYFGLGLLLVTGIVAGFVGHWWGHGWIWVSLGMLLAIAVLHTVLGTAFYGRVRKAAGLPYISGFGGKPPEPPAPEDLAILLASSRPMLLAAIGLGGLAAILWLMVFKPF